VLKPVRKKLGLPVLNFAILRRTAATLSQGMGSVKSVQTHLRHRHADVTANSYKQNISSSTRKMVNDLYESLDCQVKNESV
jgi:integrase